MPDLKIALIQTNQIWDDPEANFAHLEKTHLAKIKSKSCDLVILPEMFNTGFSMNTKDLAETESDKSIQWLKKWAKKLDCQFAASLIIKDSKKFFNRFVVVSKRGVEARYDKRHLFRMAGENNHFNAGKERVIYPLKGWKILLQVCYDLRFPVFSRNRVVLGKPEYDAVIYIANWPEKRNAIWNVLLQARAIENQAYCVGLNRVGKDGKEVVYSGDSAIIDPWGNTVFRATKNRELVKILTLSKDTITAVRTHFPAYKDAD